MFKKAAIAALCCSICFSMNLPAPADARERVDSDGPKTVSSSLFAATSANADIVGEAKCPFVEGEVLVKWKQGRASRKAAHVSEQGLTRSDAVHEENIELLEIENGKTVEEVVRELRANPNVADVQPNYIYRALATPSPADERFDEQWGLHNVGQAGGVPNFDIDAPEAWGLLEGEAPAEVVVAVLDSGFDFDHPDLAGLVWTNTGELPNNGEDDDENGYIDDVHGWDFANDDNDPSDDPQNGHGTHVSGIIAAQANELGMRGVASNVKIMPLKFLDEGGNGTTFDSLRAIQYAIDKGVMLSNNSYGSVGLTQCDTMMLEAVEQSGMLFVAAAGNSGADNDDPRFRTIPASMESDNILSVASTNRHGRLSDFSNYGATTVDVAAPGEDILSTVVDGYRSDSGTSMAAPMVTGIAAVLMGLRSDWSAEKVRGWIMDHGISFAPLAGKTVSGKMANLYHAVDFLLREGDPSPVAVTGLDTYPHPIVFPGQSSKVSYAVHPPAASTVHNAVYWTSSHPDTVTVDTYGGVFTALQPGKATLTAIASNGSFTSEQEIIVLENYPIDIEDETLEHIVRTDIGKPSGTLMRSDVYAIRELEAAGRGIQSLQGLEHFENLVSLDLRENDVESLAPIGHLNKIETLLLRDNLVEDLSPIAGYTNLLSLNVSNLPLADGWTNIVSNFAKLEEFYATGVGLEDEDIEFLADFVHLVTLYLDDNPLGSVEFAAGLTEMQYLSLKNTGISSLAPLAGMTRLEELDASGNEIEDIGALAGAARLITLNVSDNFIEDLSPLAGLRHLATVNASRNYIHTIDFDGQPLLTELNLSYNEIADLSSLANVPNLEKLEARNNAIVDVQPLSGLQWLQTLNLRNNAIEEIEGLRNLTELYELNLMSNRIADLGPIEDLDLGYLYLYNNRIEDIGPLATQLYLEELDLDSNRVADIRPLAGLDGLAYLSLSRNLITDIGPLRELEGMVWLELAENGIADISALANLGELQYLDIDDNAIVSLEALRGKANLYELYAQNNRILDVSALTNLPLEVLYVGGNPLGGIESLLTLSDLRFLQVANVTWSEANLEVLDALKAEGVIVETEGSPETPPTPTGLRATAHPSGGVALGWEPVEEADSYRVYRSVRQDGGFAFLASATEPEYRDRTAVANQTYWYRVAATNARGTSSWTAPASITLQGTSDASGGGGAPASPVVEADDSGVTLDPAKDGVVTKERTADGRELVAVALDRNKLVTALQSAMKNAPDARQVTIEIAGGEAGSRVELPAAALLDATANGGDATVTVKAGDVAYRVPASLLRTIAADAKDGNVSITVAEATESEQGRTRDAADATGVTLLLPNALSFAIHAGGQEVTDFGGVYVERRVVVPQAVNANETTAVWVDPADGRLHFVPSRFDTRNGTTEVTMKSPHNSVYTVVASNVSFEDVAGHWAQDEIELLANKRIVEGDAAGSFAPEEKVTRAQFAALLVRALGLTERTGDGTFADVASGAWYAGAAQAASEAGLVTGFEDGTFRPDAAITREQMAVMIARAIEAAGRQAPPASAESALNAFEDAAAISSWARSAVTASAEAGIVRGGTGAIFRPAGLATRAESAAMLKRLLQYVEFID